MRGGGGGVEGCWWSGVVSSFSIAKFSRAAGVPPVQNSARGRGTRPQNNVKRYLDGKRGGKGAWRGLKIGQGVQAGGSAATIIQSSANIGRTAVVKEFQPEYIRGRYTEAWPMMTTRYDDNFPLEQ